MARSSYTFRKAGALPLGLAFRVQGAVALSPRLLWPGSLQILGVPLQGKDAPGW